LQPTTLSYPLWIQMHKEYFNFSCCHHQVFG
jgi:hypothetical protein